jgi:WhiB family redox-sensing transcriptional regulator
MANFALSNYPEFLIAEPPCSQTDPEAFFAQEIYDASGKVLGARYYNEAGAKAICNSCPLITECLSYAMEYKDLLGIWGGTTEHERSNMRRRLNRRAIKTGRQTNVLK